MIVEDLSNTCVRLLTSLPQIQGVNPSMTVTRESEDGDISDRTDDSATAIELPPCELSKLDNIYSLVIGSVTSTDRLLLGLAIERETYIPKLLDLFHVCEDLENTEGLRQLFDIFRTLIFHNNASMFQVCEVFSKVDNVCALCQVTCMCGDPVPSGWVKGRSFAQYGS